VWDMLKIRERGRHFTVSRGRARPATEISHNGREKRNSMATCREEARKKGKDLYLVRYRKPKRATFAQYTLVEWGGGERGKELS